MFKKGEPLTRRSQKITLQSYFSVHSFRTNHLKLILILNYRELTHVRMKKLIHKLQKGT